MYLKNLLLILSVYFVNACSGPEQLQSRKIQSDNTEMLYGQITREQLFYDYPEWLLEYESYNPDSLAIDSLACIKFSGTIEIYLGTWCSDSRREVPRFFKIIDKSELAAPERVKLWALDRRKQLPDNLAELKKIVRVATFVFINNDGELGRIIEQPVATLEQDILAIVRNYDR